MRTIWVPFIIQQYYDQQLLHFFKPNRTLSDIFDETNCISFNSAGPAFEFASNNLAQVTRFYIHEKFTG